VNSRDASLFAEVQIDRTTDLTLILWRANPNRPYSDLRSDWIAAVREIIHPEERLQSPVGVQQINPLSLEPLSAASICSLSHTRRSTP
jgi:hypothetical protein